MVKVEILSYNTALHEFWMEQSSNDPLSLGVTASGLRFPLPSDKLSLLHGARGGAYLQNVGVVGFDTVIHRVGKESVHVVLTWFLKVGIRRARRPFLSGRRLRVVVV